MKLLLERFSGESALPIEIDDLVDAIVELGFQDEIYLFPIDSDPEELRGAIRQFRYQQVPYGEHQSVTHVVYTTRVPLCWQRLICAKELVHIFDQKAEQTDTEEEVSELIEKVLGPLSTEDYGFADLQAAADRLALYQCLPLLLPDAALQSAKAKQMEPEDLAKIAVMPVRFVKLMMSDDWEKLNGFLGEK